MRLVVIAIVMSIGCGSIAEAQVTGADCYQTPTGMHCQESGISQVERMNRQGQEDLQRFMNSGPSASDYAAMRHQQVQRRVAKAIADGKCDEAKQIALKAGDLDAADKAARLCAPPSSPAK